MVNFDGYVSSVSEGSIKEHGMDSAMAIKLAADHDAGDITLQEMNDIVVLYQVNYGVDLSSC